MINENNQEIQEVEELEELPKVEEGDEDLTDWKALALKNHGIAKRYKTKLDKVKEPVLEVKPEVKPEVKEPAISLTDMYALNKANVAEEDLNEVVEFAEFKNISIAEALKTGVIKTLLSENEEQRKVANATNVGNSKRGSTKISDQALLENTSKGVIPESDEEIGRLVAARIESKRAK